MKKYVFRILVAGMLIVFAGGCMVGNGEVTGALTISLAASRSARTITPVLPSISEYRITFSGPATVSPVSTAESVLTIDIPAGVWSITAEGMNSAGTAVVSGTVSGVNVTAGGTAVASVALTALTTGTGMIDVTVKWPSAVSPAIDACSVSLDGATPAKTALAGGVYEVVYDSAAAAASHVLTVVLWSGSNDRMTINESVQVFGNLTSSATIVLTTNDFTMPPAAPSGLVVTEGKGCTRLGWVDNSSVEESSIIERSTDQSSWATIASGAATLGPNATSYADTGAAAGQVYYYRVSAVNQLGTSVPSSSAGGSWAPPQAGGSGVLSFGTATSSSIPVSWEKATDTVSPRSDLAYCLVRSLSANIGTVELAQANGSTVMDWTADTASATASGLTASTPYWFNVLVRDAAGNMSSYAAGTTATSASTGTIALTLTVSSPTDAVITFDQVPDIICLQSSTLSISVLEAFDTYRWIVDGTDLGVSSSSLNLSCGSLSVGVHHLYVFVTKNGLLYSRSIRFTVGSG